MADDIISVVKSSLENNVYGTERTIKMLKKGELKYVVVSKNAPESIVNDINHYAAIAGVEVHRVDMDNTELGALCKKPFSVSVLGVKGD